jgi:nicotinamide-nucleotide amidase
MRIEIINTGTELLLGTTLNTHGAWIGQQLLGLGLRVARQISIPDGDEIRLALLAAFPRAEVVIVTGGLGPTSDDLTREICAELLGLPLEEDAEVIAAIRMRLARRNREMNDASRRQAQVPRGAQVLANPNGTAPGLYFPPQPGRGATGADSPHIFLLPGPPRELRPMVKDHVLPRIQAAVTGPPPPQMTVFQLAGLGESEVATTLEAPLLATGIPELGYCVKAGEVQVRVFGSEDQLAACREIVRTHFGPRFFGEGGAALETVVIRQLLAAGKRVATAESCTGGFLAHRLTNVPGASGALGMGLVTYSNEAKTELAFVPAALIETHGAVSEPVAAALAEGALRRSGADYALALTGIAGDLPRGEGNI